MSPEFPEKIDMQPKEPPLVQYTSNSPFSMRNVFALPFHAAIMSPVAVCMTALDAERSRIVGSAHSSQVPVVFCLSA